MIARCEAKDWAEVEVPFPHSWSSFWEGKQWWCWSCLARQEGGYQELTFGVRRCREGPGEMWSPGRQERHLFLWRSVTGHLGLLLTWHHLSSCVCLSFSSSIRHMLSSYLSLPLPQGKRQAFENVCGGGGSVWFQSALGVESSLETLWIYIALNWRNYVAMLQINAHRYISI